MTDNPTFTTDELAELLGCTPRRLQQLAQDKVIPKAERGRWPLAAVRKFCDHLRADQRRGPAAFADERARLTRARADMAEADLAQRRGELLLRKDVDEAVIGAFSRVRARLLTVPSNTAAEVITMSNPSEAEALIRGAIYDALEELAGTTVDDMVAGRAAGRCFDGAV